MSRIGLIGNLENRRIVDFSKTCLKLGYPKPVCLSYEAILSNPQALDDFQVERLRIDSPGENDSVTQELIALGGGPKNVDLEHGEIGFLAEYHLGFCHLMDRIQARNFDCLVCPTDISVMFDKWACHRIFLERGVARPQAELAPRSYAEFKVKLLEPNGRLFLKPLHGSSASGVCALRWMRKSAVLQAPLSITGNKLINSLRVNRFESAGEIEFILSKLLPQGMIAEQWIPKLTLPGGAVDLRVLVIDGIARHRVVRQSRHPMTNLHLGNRRGDLGKLKQRLGPEIWDTALRLAEQAAVCFPKARSTGVDILLDTSGRAWVGEINAFGDLLPNLSHDGESAYEALAKQLCA